MMAGMSLAPYCKGQNSLGKESIEITSLGTEQGTKGLRMDRRAIKQHQYSRMAVRNQLQRVTVQVQQKSISSSGTSPEWICLLGRCASLHLAIQGL